MGRGFPRAEEDICMDITSKITRSHVILRVLIKGRRYKKGESKSKRLELF